MDIEIGDNEDASISITSETIAVETAGIYVENAAGELIYSNDSETGTVTIVTDDDTSEISIPLTAADTEIIPHGLHEYNIRLRTSEGQSAPLRGTFSKEPTIGELP
jgi:hypothetical protein